MTRINAARRSLLPGMPRLAVTVTMARPRRDPT